MLSGIRVPSTESFDGKRDEGDTLSVACIVGGTHLPIPSILQGVARLGRFSIDDGRLDGRDDRDVKCSIAALIPVTKEDVSWAGCRARYQTSELACRAETRFLGRFVENVAYLVVPRDPLAVNATGYGVVTKPVTRSTTGRTGGILLENWSSQAVEEN